MFRGHSHRSIDPKGRLMLPPEFRDELQKDSPEGKVVLAKFDGCVNGYPMSRWEQVERSLNKIPNPSRRVRDFKRVFLGSAQVLQPDAQGRILIPPALREYGKLEKDVVLIGVGNKFEIWDKAHFEAIESEDFSDVFDDIQSAGVAVSL